VTIPYLEETPAGWSAIVQQTWQIEEVPDGVRLYGRCPTCDHPSETPVRLVAVAPGARSDGERKSLDSGEPERVLIVCACNQEHDGRPAEKHGCGRAGYLDLVPDD
jgi:hypothetical protein